MATTRMLLAGFGGQGVLLIGQMIAYSAMYEEKEVTWMPSYGPEMRGGTANCTVVVSDRPIASPLPSSYDVLLAMNKVSLEKYIDQLVPGGDLFINSSIIDTKVERDDINVHYVDTIGLAESKIGNEKTANMVNAGSDPAYYRRRRESYDGKDLRKTDDGKKSEADRAEYEGDRGMGRLKYGKGYSSTWTLWKWEN